MALSFKKALERARRKGVPPEMLAEMLQNALDESAIADNPELEAGRPSPMTGYPSR